MEVNLINKIRKHLLQFVAHALAYLFFGYGWQGFVPRLCIVGISLKLNPYSSAVSYSSTGGMKLFLLTCAILAYSICKLVFDYTKQGVELERQRRVKSEEP